MSYSLTPPRSSNGSAGKEDADATGGIGVGDAATGIVFATEVPILPVTASASRSGSGVISESDVGSLGSSSIDVPGHIPSATGAISAQLLCPNFKRTCNATVGLHKQSPDPQNEVIRTKFRHLIVKYQPNNVRALDYKQPHSHITGQNRLQTPGAPTRSALGPTSVPIRPHPPRSTPLLKWIHPQSKKPVHVIGRGPSMGN
ncbi:hypothetical protein M9H77_22227 [Catharanthus roseus]|uniref:Uncharacterized protein n=1 Tax=Catharanthus roseus TaxID=4058 RepID=A0ACC0APX2_CATRO|nr:hypothetical protein M9H77_22227 [Catharanthus roseus]